MKRPLLLVLGILLVLPLAVSTAQGPIATSNPPVSTTGVHTTADPSPYGMNMYFTNAGRNDAEVSQLVPLAQAIDVHWSREQLSWASYDLSWGPPFFDQRINTVVQSGFPIYATLCTTPDRFSTQECKDWADANGRPRYFCPPANPADFAAWAGEVTERYDGDGYLDAPGSPRIPYWEIWNEPDVMDTWLPQPDPATYASMLCQSYQAIKAADPTAKVMIGGIAGFDTVGRDGFMDAVVANGGWPCFDILAYHLYDFPYPPEEPGAVWSMTAVSDMVMNWLAAHGGGKEVWANEFGWSTCTGQSECNTEDEQANYLIRAHPLLMGHGFTHLDAVQLKDILGGMPTPYQEMAILRPDFTGKPSYYAYGVLMQLVGDAQFIGEGQLLDVHDSWSDRYDYTYYNSSDGTLTDILWQLQDQASYSFWVGSTVSQVYLYDRDGTYQVLTPVGGYVTVTLSPRPCYLVRSLNLNYHTFLPLLFRQ